MRVHNHELKLSTVSAWFGFILVLVGAVVGTINFFETKANAQTEHAKLAAWDEAGMLENQLDLCELEIKYLLNLDRELTADEANRLAFLRAKQIDLDARLREIRGSQRE